MATIRGFISMLGFADNRPNYVAQFGEFSTVVSTYSRDIQFFSKDTLPGVTFSALYSVDNSSPWQITSTVGEQILTVGKWVYDQYNANLIPRNTSKAAFIAALTDQFPSLSNFVVGTLLAGPTSTKNMPDYVRFDIGQVHSVQVWFADSAIKAQYDFFEIQVIPPVSDINQLNNASSVVQTAIVNRKYADIRRLAEAIIGEDPPTFDTTYDLTWKDPTGSGATLELSWSIIGYGPLSADEEYIKDAIKLYLTNVAPNVDWSKIFPSLYASNEFVIVPLWLNTSPATENVDGGSYSPIMKWNDLKTAITPRVPVGYAAQTNLNTHLNNYLEVLSSVWRSMPLLAVGSPSNLATTRQLSKIIPDYLTVPTTNADWGRISPNTASFIEKLNFGLEEARRFSPTSVAPSGYFKRISGGRIYLSFNHGDYKIMILTRFSYSTLI